MYIEKLLGLGSFQIMHSPILRRFTDYGSDVMYLSVLSVSVTVKKRGRNFQAKLKY